MFSPEYYWITKRIGKGNMPKAWARMDLPQYNDWRADRGDVALRCGGEMGICVLDVDTAVDGKVSDDTIAELLAMGLPETLKVPTGSGGWHYYFEYHGEPLGTHIRFSSKGDLDFIYNTLVFLWPDERGKLTHYDTKLIAPLPDSIIERLQAPKPEGGKLLTLDPGGRNNAVASLAGSLLKAGVPLQQAHDELQKLSAHSAHPLAPIEIAQTVASIARYHSKPAAEPVPDISAWGESLAEIEALSLPPISSAIGPLMLATTTTLHGESGAGKSLFAEWLAVRMAQGSYMGDWQAPKPLKVLLLDQENPSAYLQQRFAGLLSLAGPNLRVIHRDYLRRKGFRFNLSIREHQQILIDQDFDFLIMDSLAAVAPGTENLPMTAAEWFEQLMQMSDEITNAGRGILMLGNLNKRGEIYGTAAQIWRTDRSWTAERWKTQAELDGISAALHIEVGKSRGLEEMTAKSSWSFDIKLGWVRG